MTRSARRGGEWTRRFIVIIVFFAVVIAPFLLAHSPEGVTVGQGKKLPIWVNQGYRISDFIRLFNIT